MPQNTCPRLDLLPDTLGLLSCSHRLPPHSLHLLRVYQTPPSKSQHISPFYLYTPEHQWPTKRHFEHTMSRNAKPRVFTRAYQRHTLDTSHPHASLSISHNIPPIRQSLWHGVEHVSLSSEYRNHTPTTPEPDLLVVHLVRRCGGRGLVALPRGLAAMAT